MDQCYQPSTARWHLPPSVCWQLGLAHRPIATRHTLTVTELCGLTVGWRKTWLWGTTTSTAETAKTAILEEGYQTTAKAHGATFWAHSEGTHYTYQHFPCNFLWCRDLPSFRRTFDKDPQPHCGCFAWQIKKLCLRELLCSWQSMKCLTRHFLSCARRSVRQWVGIEVQRSFFHFGWRGGWQQCGCRQSHLHALAKTLGKSDCSWSCCNRDCHDKQSWRPAATTTIGLATTRSQNLFSSSMGCKWYSWMRFLV